MFLHLSVSHSVHMGGCLPQCMLEYNLPGQIPPPPGQIPPGQTPTLGRHPRADTPPPTGRRPLQQTVRILLECFLVKLILFIQTHAVLIDDFFNFCVLCIITRNLKFDIISSILYYMHQKVYGTEHRL